MDLWSIVLYQDSPWWRHQMEAFSSLLTICAGKSPVPGEFPIQRPVTRSFDVFFDLLSRGWWFETSSRALWRHRNVPKKSSQRKDRALFGWQDETECYLPSVGKDCCAISWQMCCANLRSFHILYRVKVQKKYSYEIWNISLRLAQKMFRSFQNNAMHNMYDFCLVNCSKYFMI